MSWFNKLFARKQQAAQIGEECPTDDGESEEPSAPVPAPTRPAAIADGAWVWIWVGDQRLLAFTYRDPTAGPSAKGGPVPPGSEAAVIVAAVERPGHTVRIVEGAWRIEPIPDAEGEVMSLPVEPTWISACGRIQPWRRDGRLAGRFHADRPDDLQVLVHDGGPKTSRNPPELIWARVVAARGTDYVAVALNQPHAVRTVVEGQHFTFRVVGAPHLLLVGAAYLSERDGWQIEPCSGCGLDELLDPPSRLAAISFGNTGGSLPVAFTQHCPLCHNGSLMVRRATVRSDAPEWQNR